MGAGRSIVDVSKRSVTVPAHDPRPTEGNASVCDECGWAIWSSNSGWRHFERTVR